MSAISGPNYLGKTSDSPTKFFSDGSLQGGGSSLWTLSKQRSTSTSTLSTIPKNANVLINGDLTVNGTINNPSDARLKNNVSDLPAEYANMLMKISPKSFTFNSDLSNSTHFGVIAQEIEDIFPNLVKETHVDSTGSTHKCVNYLEMIPLLLLKMQDLQHQIDQLRNNNNGAINFAP